MKKCIVAMAVMCMCIQLVVPSMTVYATENTEEPPEMVLPTGLIQPEEKNVGEITAEEIYVEVEGDNGELLYSSRYASEWDSYSNNYIYNTLSATERAFWDKLDAMCLALLLGTDDSEDNNGSKMTEFVEYDGLTQSEAKTLAYLFRYSNPQYYFLNTVLWGGTFGGQGYVALGVYTAFGDGSARQSATQSVKNQIDTWAATANSYGTEAEKVKVIHDLIVNKVDYNNDAYSSDFDDDTAYSQSAYSVFCMDKTVCAGYAQAFEVICNAVGVDCISVTSYNHQWNKVLINDSWYNVDCTWDDQSTIYYNYFERSDAVYDSDSATYASSHAEESFWEEYLPACTLDSGACYTDPGTLPTITQTTASPVITFAAGNGGYTTTISSTTPNASIYYTLDGTEPTPSYTRSYKYNGAFTVDSGVTINAVAVCDTYWDSSVASQQTENGSTGGNTTGGNEAEGSQTGGNEPSGDQVSSNTVTGKARFVALLYENVLERYATESEIADWVRELESGKTGAEVAYGFLFSQEFTNKNLSNSDYVERLYMSMMGRASDSAGKADWVTHLENGVSRLYVFKQFVDSEEFTNLCDSYGITRGDVALGEARDMNYNVTRFVARNYTEFLGRDYDVAGLNDWTSRINNRVQTMQEIASGFVFSQECANMNQSNEEYVEMLYRGCFDRPGDAAGVADWVTQLNTGVSDREDVFWGFANSQEFSDMVKSYGL